MMLHLSNAPLSILVQERGGIFTHKQESLSVVLVNKGVSKHN